MSRAGVVRWPSTSTFGYTERGHSVAGAVAAPLADGRRADRRGTAPPGVGHSAHAVRRRQLARDVLRDRCRALNRRWIGVGADAVAGGGRAWETLTKEDRR